jgi:RimJ/RimL family protein N-acetyltransferase
MSLAPPLPLVTERLTLRFAGPVDARAMLAYKSQPDVVRYVPYPPLTFDAIVERLGETGCWTRRTLDAEGDAVTIAVTETATAKLVGDVVLIWTSEIHRVIEIGYILDPQFTGRGYATEAAAALVTIAFDHFDAHRVVATIDARNSASVRVVERLAMRCEARHLSDHWSKGEWASTLVYAITEDEWRAGNGSERRG